MEAPFRLADLAGRPRNRAEALSFTANSPTGLYLVPEPAEAPESEAPQTVSIA
jgi:hypothetical protein